MAPDYCPRISQRLQIAVPESEGYVLESFMNGQGEGGGKQYICTIMWFKTGS